MSVASETTIYKVLTDAEMKALEQDGRFAGSADDARDGYVHLSTAAQLTATVDKHYAGQDGLWIAALDVEAIGRSLKWEPARGGEDFPHLYGELLLETVIAYSELTRDGDGRVRLPVAG